jgi:hypothetical protein
MKLEMQNDTMAWGYSWDRGYYSLATTTNYIQNKKPFSISPKRNVPMLQ